MNEVSFRLDTDVLTDVSLSLSLYPCFKVDTDTPQVGSQYKSCVPYVERKIMDIMVNICNGTWPHVYHTIRIHFYISLKMSERKKPLNLLPKKVNFNISTIRV